MSLTSLDCPVRGMGSLCKRQGTRPPRRQSDGTAPVEVTVGARVEALRQALLLGALPGPETAVLGRLGALRAHTEAPHTTDLLWN